jgi:hypothetical protein
MRLLELFSTLENNDDVHLARLLVLLKSFSGDQGTDPVKGLTKLVKLDFLLRYPLFLERALKALNAPGDVHLCAHEKMSVESSMIRYHYGPWDRRYRRFVNLLVGKGLIEVHQEGNTIVIKLTKSGNEKALDLSLDANFEDVKYRADILKKHFKSTGAMSLKNFIYETFPEIISLKKGEEITIEQL